MAKPSSIAFLNRLRHSRRPFPTGEERDALVVSLAGPFAILIGAITVLHGLF